LGETKLKLKPFFSYFGSKWGSISKYPAPRHTYIIEPFAGSATYALHYSQNRILLVDKDEIICGVWDYLIRVSSDEILRLPDVNGSVDDLNITQEAKWLIGFCLNKACTGPRKTPSKWLRSKAKPDASFWGDLKRQRIAEQIEYIRHWQIKQADYTEIENEEATWFIDPPYEFGGHEYKCSNKNIDFDKLAEWCKERNGQAIVCENTKATWLPFKPMKEMQGTMFKTTEAIWSNLKTNYDNEQILLQF
jgi:site-specific DNA-adenine methylase